MIVQNKSLKVILAGNHEAGKTLFMMRWRDPESPSVTQPTIGTDLVCKDVQIGDNCFKVQLWDTAGQEVYHSITAPYFRSCRGVFLVFDITDRAGFESLDYWMNLIRENSFEMPFVVIVANKCDLPHADDVRHDVTEYCKARDLPLFFTSALTGENVENAANCMIKKLAETTRSVPQVHTFDLTKPQEAPKQCC